MITVRSRSITEWDSLPMVGDLQAHDTGVMRSGAVPVTNWTDETGATAVEYGLVTMAVSVGLIVLGPFLAEAFVTFLDVVLDSVLGQ